MALQNLEPFLQGSLPSSMAPASFPSVDGRAAEPLTVFSIDQLLGIGRAIERVFRQGNKLLVLFCRANTLLKSLGIVEQKVLLNQSQLRLS